MVSPSNVVPAERSAKKAPSVSGGASGWFDAMTYDVQPPRPAIGGRGGGCGGRNEKCVHAANLVDVSTSVNEVLESVFGVGVFR
jgi:hypothetical protein